MKSTTVYIFILIFLLIPDLLVSEGWIRINPKQYGPSLNDVAMLNNDTVIVVGHNGTIMSTHDGGDNWIISDSIFGFSSTLNGIYFRDQKNGYVVGGSGIVLKTNNAGITWNLNIIDPDYYYDDVILSDIFFIDSLNGFTAGYGHDQEGEIQNYYYSGLWSTNDGGSTWQTVNLPIEWWTYEEFLTELYFVNADIGWFYGKGDSVFKTIDGGKNWYRTPWINDDNFVDMFFISDDVGWALSEQSLHKTYDGGVTWNQIYEVSGKPREIYFIDENEGVLIASTTILKTYDGGESWEIIYSGDVGLHALDFKNNTGWIVGGHGIKLLSENGGNTWNSGVEQAITRQSLYSTFFTDSLHGWAVGFNGIILRTVDGGVNWDKQYLDIERLNDVYFTSESDGWVVGSDGYAFETRDGGYTWQKRKISDRFTLNSVFFYGDRVGWIIDNYTIYTTVDEGANWSRIVPSFTDWIEDIYFINDKTGWLVTKSEVYKTFDSGYNWSLLYTAYEGFQEVQFINEDIGWIRGYESLFKTVNGGNSWKKINVIQSATYKSIYFVDELTGWFSTQHIYKTIDGGNTWGRQTYEDKILTTYRSRLNDIYFTDKNNGCIVGSGGSIVITNDGGGPSEPINVEITLESKLHNIKNFPNPFPISTKIEYELLEDAHIRIDIYNILGQNVVNLLNKFQFNGSQQIRWDGKNSQEQKLPSGIYIYTIIANGERVSKKMILLR